MLPRLHIQPRMGRNISDSYKKHKFHCHGRNKERQKPTVFSTITCSDRTLGRLIKLTININMEDFLLHIFIFLRKFCVGVFFAEHNHSREFPNRLFQESENTRVHHRNLRRKSWIQSTHAYTQYDLFKFSTSSLTRFKTTLSNCTGPLSVWKLRRWGVYTGCFSVPDVTDISWEIGWRGRWVTRDRGGQSGPRTRVTGLIFWFESSYSSTVLPFCAYFT
jgi:hypothetical protein